MFRPQHTEIELTNLSEQIKINLIDRIKAGDTEVVNQKGVMKAWVNSAEAETLALFIEQTGQGKILNNFPEKYDKDGKQITSETLKSTDLSSCISKEDAIIKNMEKHLNSITKSEIVKEAEACGIKLSDKDTKAVLISKFLELMRSKK